MSFETTATFPDRVREVLTNRVLYERGVVGGILALTSDQCTGWTESLIIPGLCTRKWLGRRRILLLGTGH